MLPRALILSLLPVLCTACASEHAPKVMGYQATAHPLATNSASSSPTGATPPTARPLIPAKKSMADKVLTAIALERVTGRKSDPARLAEAY